MSLPIDEQFLAELGFLPNGENLNEFGLTILDHETDEVDDDEPHIQLLFAMNTDEMFLEAYDGGGESTLVTRIPTARTRDELVTLLKCLGSYRPASRNAICREMTAYEREESGSFVVGCQILICEYITVLRHKSEVIVYGSGSDWMVQYSKVTSGHGNFRRWFSDRTKATEYGRALASEEYRGHKAHQENPLAPMRDIGEGIMNFVIDHKLVTAECPDSPGSGVMMVWSANAPEQITRFVADYGYKTEADPLGG